MQKFSVPILCGKKNFAPGNGGEGGGVVVAGALPWPSFPYGPAVMDVFNGHSLIQLRK